MCLPCMLSRSKTIAKSYNKKKEPCKYTLQELLDLNEQVSNTFLTSQINIYRANCNRYNKQIDELFNSL